MQQRKPRPFVSVSLLTELLRWTPQPFSGFVGGPVVVTVGGVVCLATSPVPGSITTSEQIPITCSPVTVASQVLAAKLPLPANSKIVTLAVPSTQGGRKHERHPFWPAFVLKGP